MDGARGWMPAIWRPNVRMSLDDDGEVKDTESGGGEVTKQGTKRKRAPATVVSALSARSVAQRINESRD